MSALTAPALVAAGLLVLAGAQKVLDPAMTVGALRALGLPSAPALVRVGAATEMVLGASALSTGDPALWVLVAVSYLAFALVVVAAIRKGTMIGSCGCFGREDTPPHWIHVVLDVALAGVALSVAGSGDVTLSSLGDRPAFGALVVALAALGLVLTYAAFVDLPRTLSNGRRARGGLR
ncbi:MAG: MauE/DoxX family redox-associated membrane protein [Microthrixaceae bacterium]